VFTTNANANPNAGTPQKSSLEIRVKDAPKRNVGIRVKDNPNQIEEFFMKMLGGIPRGGKIH